MTQRRRKTRVLPSPSSGRRVSFESLVENTAMKYVTRVGVPALLAVAVFLGQQYWGTFLNEIKVLHIKNEQQDERMTFEQKRINEELAADRKENSAIQHDIVETISGIQQTVGQQQILIQQQYNELKDDGNDRSRRLDRLEDRLNIGPGKN